MKKLDLMQKMNGVGVNPRLDCHTIYLVVCHGIVLRFGIGRKNYLLLSFVQHSRELIRLKRIYNF
jgi:hypothetical protein